MKKVTVATTVTVLGQKLTRKEAEALYFELQRELKMSPPPPVTVPVPYPVYPRPYYEQPSLIGVTYPTYTSNKVDRLLPGSINCDYRIES